MNIYFILQIIFTAIINISIISDNYLIGKLTFYGYQKLLILFTYLYGAVVLLNIIIICYLFFERKISINKNTDNLNVTLNIWCIMMLISSFIINYEIYLVLIVKFFPLNLLIMSYTISILTIIYIILMLLSKLKIYIKKYIIISIYIITLTLLIYKLTDIFTG